MAASAGSERALVVRSHAGPYRVVFDEAPFSGLADDGAAPDHFLIDRRVAELHGADLEPILGRAHLVDAAEESKSLEQMPAFVEQLVGGGIRRDHTLVAIGGGIVQDIACFLAASLFRGVRWRFYPTTLLAQADSCIGSKSSINVGKLKNVIGTFTPPAEVRIATSVLATLDERDVRSGIGEMLKVQAIEGPASFDAIAADYPRLATDRALLERYVFRSLELKRPLVEEDEFDRGSRNVLNYGHSFGHAIETATGFSIPHGIAVTIGMDMANYVAAELQLAPAGHYERMHGVLAANAAGYGGVEVPLEPFMSALAKDKKNVGDELRLVLPLADGRPAVTAVANDEAFRAHCTSYLEERPAG